MPASPATPMASRRPRAGARVAEAGGRLGKTIARAAPMSSSKARVSVPSYTRVGSYPGWWRSPIASAEAAAPARVRRASPRRLRTVQIASNSNQGHTR
jgi:hypothetical protein